MEGVFLPRMLVEVGRSRLWGQKEIPDEWCGIGFRNAEKLSRRVPRRLNEFFTYAAALLIGRPIAIVVSTA